ncbi:MAG TPA: hypothetical protein V6D05_11025 [Stenomitos sp.]
MKRLWAIALSTLSLAAPAWASDTTPSSEQIDPYMLELKPELRHQMQGTHLLGLVGIGQVQGEPAYALDLAGWSFWDRRFYAEASLGGVFFSPKTLGIQKDPQNPNDRGNLLLPVGEASVGYNLIGIKEASRELEPLFNLNDRAFLTVGAGVAAGFTYTKADQYGFGMTVGPMVGARYKLMDWHNLNVYGRYLYGLNRAEDTYEAAFHTSFGTNVIELGYRGGQSASYLQRNVASGTDSLLADPAAVPYGAWFVRFSQGY